MNYSAEPDQAAVHCDFSPHDDRGVDERKYNPQGSVQPGEAAVDLGRRDVCVPEEELAVPEDRAREVDAYAEVAEHAEVHVRLRRAEDAHRGDDVVDEGLGLEPLESETAAIEDLVRDLQAERVERQPRGESGPGQGRQQGHGAVVDDDEQELHRDPLLGHPPAVPLVRLLHVHLYVLTPAAAHLLPRLVPELGEEAARHTQQHRGLGAIVATGRAKQRCDDQRLRYLPPRARAKRERLPREDGAEQREGA
eukprot:CAMPEP_0179283566 /NCGR_PEP_ID=MMETSP0797-20121207/38244_1 /TAXON_ID=47934 /ORGANISM="Dinophysis acuminata, Strain DAEP01" /LENGTH=250 /DNA_ID=CAMNT_0020992327 /DNA_START=151 /DNA_END=900 /DNA_ORIENTATION=-